MWQGSKTLAVTRNIPVSFHNSTVLFCNTAVADRVWFPMPRSRTLLSTLVRQICRYIDRRCALSAGGQDAANGLVAVDIV